MIWNFRSFALIFLKPWSCWSEVGILKFLYIPVYVLHLLDSFPYLFFKLNKKLFHDIITSYKLSCLLFLIIWIFYRLYHLVYASWFYLKRIILARMVIFPHPLNCSYPFSTHNISYFQSSLGLKKKKAWPWFTENCNLILWNNRLFICAPCNDPKICHRISALEKNNATQKKRKYWQHSKD